jgi:hypothetical protein
MAQKSQQAYLSVATAQGSTDAITGLTNANPGVVTATAHGNANGSVGIITGVVGMPQVNNRAFVIANQATNTFELKGVDTTALQGYGTYVSGGIWTPQTMTEVGEVKGITSAFDGEAADIDVTHLRSLGKEYLTGLPEFGNVSLVLWLPPGSDVGQTKLRALREIQAITGLVKSFALTGLDVDGAIQAACAIKVSNAPAWFA